MKFKGPSIVRGILSSDSVVCVRFASEAVTQTRLDGVRSGFESDINLTLGSISLMPAPVA